MKKINTNTIKNTATLRSFFVKIEVSIFILILMLPHLTAKSNPVANTDKIPVRWVDSVLRVPVGVTFGVPLPKGNFRKGDPVTLADNSGQPLPTQSWILATWPDRSVKWLAMAAVVGPECAAGLQVLRAHSPDPATPIKVYRHSIEVFNRVETGAITVDVGDPGTAIIQEIRCKERTRTSEVNLIVRRERMHNENGREVHDIEKFTDLIKKYEVEQSGPVCSVIRLEGVHRGETGGEEWLPFTLRLVFWSGLDRIDVKHTIIFNGDPAKDFISGLGLRVRVVLEDGPENHFPRYLTADERTGDLLNEILAADRTPNTNQCAQWGLNAIAPLALGGDSLTDEIAAIKPPQNK